LINQRYNKFLIQQAKNKNIFLSIKKRGTTPSKQTQTTKAQKGLRILIYF